MYKLLIVSIVFIFYTVNASAITDQPKHDTAVEWPTLSWVSNKDALKKSNKFNSSVESLFSKQSFDLYGKTNSLLIIKDGKILFEKYNTGINENTKLVSWSMAKSFTGALTGIMIDKNYFDSINQKNLLSHWQDQRSDITIDHLLNMKSGLEFVEQYNISGHSDAAEMLFGNGKFNQAHYASKLPLKRIPGTYFDYSTGTTNILSMVIKNNLRAKGIDYYQFIEDNLLNKIGLNNTTLEFDKSDNFIGGSSVYANARDYAKFGYLYLRDGLWNGEQIISKDWIDQTREPSKHTDNQYSNKFWHINNNKYNLPDDTYYCAGFGGQFILIIPSKDIVLVRLGEAYNTNSEKTLYLLGNIISEI